MNAATKIPGEWPSNRWSYAALFAVTFVLQFFWVRIGWAQECVERGNLHAGLKPPMFAITGWTVPLTGWFGIRAVHLGHWSLWLGLGPRNGAPRLTVFPKRRRA